ncbi:hypothetical protein D3C84_436110 [compost metagenome]
MSGDEVLQYVQTFTEVRHDRRFDDGTIRLGHQATHTGQLTDLGGGAPRTRVGHHEDAVERGLLFFFTQGVDVPLLGEVIHHGLGDAIVRAGPDIDNLVIAFASGHQTGQELVLDLGNFGFGCRNDVFLGIRDDHVIDTNGSTGQGRVVETGIHQLVSEDDGVLQALLAIAGVQQTGDELFAQRLVGYGFDPVLRIGIQIGLLGGSQHLRLVDQRVFHAFRQDQAQDRTTNGGVLHLGVRQQGTVFLTQVFGNAHFHTSMEIGQTGAIDLLGFFRAGQHHTFALGVDTGTGHVVQTQDHVLGRNDDRLTGGRRQDVVGRHHQGARFQLGFQGQRYVDRHLVTIEVRVIGGTNERVQLDGLAFDQGRFKRLDTQTVQGRCTVQQDRVFADHFVQDVPNDGFFALHHFLGGLDGGRQTTGFQLAIDEGLEQLERHLLRQTALMQTQRRTYGDNGTTGVVDTFTQQVLTETTLLTLDHVGQGFQRALVGTCDGTTTTAVVQQGIHGLLQHALFVAHDDVRSRQIQQTLQAVVTVDHATVQIVQIGSRETAAVQRYQRTQVRRQHRQHCHDHPLRLVAGLQEGFHQLQTLGGLLALGLGVGLIQLLAHGLDFTFQIDGTQQCKDRFGTHLGVEFVAPLFQCVQIVLFGQHLAALEVGHAGFDNHIGFEIQHALDVTQGHVQQQTDTGRQGLQEPDVGSRAGQLDVAHALATDLGLGHFYAALLADHTTVFQALVLAAQTLVVLHRSEDTGAEQTITFRLESPVVDGLRLFDLTE